MKKPRVALVIGSGGLKCAAALGLLKVLEREKIAIDLYVGCSGGSLYTALLAQGRSFGEILEANRLWSVSLFEKRHRRSLLQAVLPSFFGFDETFGFVDDRKINAALRDLLKDATFEGLAAPLHIVATDLKTGEKVTISGGRVVDAVRASIAIPFILAPWRVEGRLLIDGGASDPLPVDVAIREGADIILAMGFENPLVSAIPSAVRLALQTSAITINHLLRSTYAFHNLAHHAEVIPIMPAFDRPIGITDVHLAPYIIERGEVAAEREIPYLRKLLSAAVAS